MVNLFPREVHRVLNLFPRELIEGTSKDFPMANLRPHQRPDPRPKPRGAAGPKVFWPKVWPEMQQRVFLRKFLRVACNQLPREQIKNSMDLPRVQPGKSIGKRTIHLTEFNPKQHCRDFFRMGFYH